MEKIKLYDITGKSVKEIEFSLPNTTKVYEQAMFDQVLAENAGKRQGTHSTLTKGEVRGGGKKPLQQKHSGNARQGSIRNPHWVGGGVVFGPKPNRNYKLAVNKQVSRKAFDSALLLKIQSNNIFIIDDLKEAKPSTKKAVALFKALKINDQKNLFVAADSKNAINAIKTFSNIKKTVAKKVNQISTRDILNAKNLVIELSAANKLGKVGA